MSFSTDVKQQLIAHTADNCDNGPRADCCLWAETCGLLLYSSLLSDSKPPLRTDSGEIARYIAELLSGQLGVFVDITRQRKNSNENGKQYSVLIPEEHQRKMAAGELSAFAERGGFEPKPDGDFDTIGAFITLMMSREECCRGAYLRGAFLASGSVAEPEKSYCLELCVPGEKTGRQLSELLGEIGVKSGTALRYGRRYVYIHDSDGIETVLAAIGAGNAYFQLINLKILREQRNVANRRRNCDDANISKTVSAAGQQVDAIRRIEKNHGLLSLPPELREVARLRLDNPYMSLRELGELMTEPLSRSGVNHRLRRIMQIAGELSGGREKKE